MSMKSINTQKKRYATVSFISKDVLITARHCVHNKEQLDYLEFFSPEKEEWIKLSPNEYQVYYYTEKFSGFENDLALIKIICKKKLKYLYKGHFSISEVVFKTNTANFLINSSGYPCVKFAINSTAPDTLINRTTSSAFVELNPTGSMIGHSLCMCSGDSGGPIWYQTGDGQYCVIGVNQGSKSNEQGFQNHNLNIGVYINQNVKLWIDSIVK
jgi:V8-like Glu-specific endopeptidase